jgi:hypothetical protein
MYFIALVAAALLAVNPSPIPPIPSPTETIVSGKHYYFSYRIVIPTETMNAEVGDARSKVKRLSSALKSCFPSLPWAQKRKKAKNVIEESESVAVPTEIKDNGKLRKLTL